MSDGNPDLLFDLSGKTAVVTGGTRGIGMMIAEGLVRRGVRVLVTSRKADACQTAVATLSEFGQADGLPLDLSQPEAASELAGWVGSLTDRLDILVNNAGTSWGAEFGELTSAEWDRVMDLNARAVYFVTQSLHSLLCAAATPDNPSRVLNITSIEALRLPMDPANFVYPASKAATAHLTRVLARRLARDDITVNALAPGPFETKMTAYALGSAMGRVQIGSMLPLRRIGRPDDIVGATVFLLSKASSFVTGCVLPIDGGYTATR